MKKCYLAIMENSSGELCSAMVQVWFFQNARKAYTIVNEASGCNIIDMKRIK